MVISIAGVGYAGAGAYFDLLCEYENIEHTPNLFELGIMYEPDGLIDLINKLKYNNNKFSAYVPIERFLNLAKFYNDHQWFRNFTGGFLYEESLKFIDSLDPIRIKGYHIFDMANPSKGDKWKTFVKNNIVIRLNHRLGFNLSINMDRDFVIYLGDKDLDLLAKRYMTSIIQHLVKKNTGRMLIKHLCPPDIPQVCFPYLPDNTRHITVNRDPRDLYVLGKINNTRDFPIEKVEDFVRYYKVYMRRQEPHEGVMFTRFEDLCYDYENTTEKVRLFLNEECHQNSRLCFIPEKSINNTQLFKKHNELKKDILYIEDNLSEYLYPFEKYIL